MKGIIFTILENFIVENYGDEKYETILEKCNLETKEPFISSGTYPDGDLIEMVVKSAEDLKITVDQTLQAFGKYAFHQLAKLMPMFVDKYSDPKEFLKSVEGIIHVEVNKLYKDAITPKFTYTDTGPNELVITYFSARKLYALMEGLLEGVSEYFKVPIQQSKKIYSKDGQEFCDFEIVFLTNK